VTDESLEKPATAKDPLLIALQTGFPIEPRPFRTIAETFGMTERAVIDAIIRYKSEGNIRSFGPVFEPVRLGYVSTLAAARVDMERMAELAAAMLDIHEITHNYVRESDWNLWFTITARDHDTLENLLKWVEKFPGVSSLINLPIKKAYKISAVWDMSDTYRTPVQPDEPPAEIDEDGRKLIKALQHDFPILENPFGLVAGMVNSDPDTVMNTIRRWIDTGVIRRFGARLNHRKLGFTTNMLTVWRGKNIDQWGEKFGRLDFVSHCYQREFYQNWPYELYAMVHSHSMNEMQKFIRLMNELAVGAQMIRLKTLYELKKSTMKYFMEE
jgi:siroheme decarboxylase